MTVLGYHTAHELADLLAAKVSNVTDLARNVATADTSQAAWPAWAADYASFHAGWDPVAADVAAFVADAKGSFLGWDSPTDDQHWNALLSAIAPLSDLIFRWTFGAYASRPTPQPTAGDTDLNVLNAINTLPVVGAHPTPTTTGKWIAVGVGVGLLGVVLLKRLV